MGEPENRIPHKRMNGKYKILQQTYMAYPAAVTFKYSFNLVLVDGIKEKKLNMTVHMNQIKMFVFT